MKQILIRGGLLFTFLSFIFSQNLLASEYLIGAAKSDITADVAERGMMGYFDDKQKSAGIHTRLFARSFVIEDTQTKTVLALTNCDLGMISDTVKEHVVKILDQKLPGVFSEEQLMLMATHTHSGSGGYFHYAIYNLSVMGYSKKNSQKIAGGIAESIIEAYKKRRLGTISYETSMARNIGVNRNPDIHRGNHDFQKNISNIDDQMKMLIFRDKYGEKIGIFNWFSVHATSITRFNGLISGDNKGIAAYLMEKKFGGNFIAAFANGAEGDVSPRVFRDREKKIYDQYERAKIHGERQFNLALETIKKNGEERAERGFEKEIQGPLGFAHRWVKMNGYQLEKEWIGKDKTICSPAIGLSTAAGSGVDGPSNIKGFYEGMRQDSPINHTALFLGLKLTWPIRLGSEGDEKCHFPKPILIANTAISQHDLPSYLPFQFFKVGPIGILSVPGEMTTQAGRRLKAYLKESAYEKLGVKELIIAGLANSYSQYITTYDEYQEQYYEGASTIYGPNTLSAYKQIYGKIIESWDQKNSFYENWNPPRRKDRKFFEIDLQGRVVLDLPKYGGKFGEVTMPPRETYIRGQTVHVSFKAGHPRNVPPDFRTFLIIEKWDQENKSWKEILDDHDPETRFYWDRDSSPLHLACSDATIRWKTGKETLPGKYRIKHLGYSKNFIFKKPYIGSSASFEVF